MKVESIKVFNMPTHYAILDQYKDNYVYGEAGKVIKFNSLHSARNYISKHLNDIHNRYRVVGYTGE